MTGSMKEEHPTLSIEWMSEAAMIKYINDHGLLVDPSTNPPTCIGYIFNFAGHGAYSPSYKIGDLTLEEIATHNKLLAEAEWQGMLKQGCGTLYLKRENGRNIVSDWPGVHRIETTYSKSSWHNFAGRNGRTDVWFYIGKDRWHGVNIGDNQILRVKRVKS